LVVYTILACGHKIYIHNEEPKEKKKGKECRRKNLRGMK
jgi:hypothetical protein